MKRMLALITITSVLGACSCAPQNSEEYLLVESVSDIPAELKEMKTKEFLNILKQFLKKGTSFEEVVLPGFVEVMAALVTSGVTPDEDMALIYSSWLFTLLIKSPKAIFTLYKELDKLENQSALPKYVLDQKFTSNRAVPTIFVLKRFHDNFKTIDNWIEIWNGLMDCFVKIIHIRKKFPDAGPVIIQTIVDVFSAAG